ncbi:hypothetical protein KQX54_011909 [Cotesia glomerata]|uniref:Uncharacterized protein n=1 Tax=Cotesia glomerata TaxID=32391 RepID=A0AAV7J3C4_COTGL|nr:hypothetical protein KQX54_011909 [Cotesia glomerata]
MGLCRRRYRRRSRHRRGHIYQTTNFEESNSPYLYLLVRNNRAIGKFIFALPRMLRSVMVQAGAYMITIRTHTNISMSMCLCIYTYCLYTGVNIAQKRAVCDARLTEVQTRCRVNATCITVQYHPHHHHHHHHHCHQLEPQQGHQQKQKQQEHQSLIYFNIDVGVYNVHWKDHFTFDGNFSTWTIWLFSVSESELLHRSFIVLGFWWNKVGKVEGRKGMIEREDSRGDFLSQFLSDTTLPSGIGIWSRAVVLSVGIGGRLRFGEIQEGRFREYRKSTVLYDDMRVVVGSTSAGICGGAVTAAGALVIVLVLVLVESRSKVDGSIPQY